MNKHAEKLISKGRFGDTILAHINPSEALLLKLAGGSGTINPDTGLPEFFGFGDIWSGISNIVSAPSQWTADALHSITGGGDFEKLSDSIKGRNDAGFSGMIDTLADPTGTTNLAANYTGSVMPEWMKSGVDMIAPIAGGIVGGVYGGPWGAAGGAAAGSGLASKLRGKSYVDQQQAALLSGALAYGGAKVLGGAGGAVDGTSSTIPAGGAGPEAIGAGGMSADLATGGAMYTDPSATYLTGAGIGLGGGSELLSNGPGASIGEPNLDVAANQSLTQQQGVLDTITGAGSAGAKTGGLMNMLGNNKMLAALLASGLYSSYATGKENADIAEANRNALMGAINKESWTPESREMNSNAIETTINTALDAQRKRSAGAGADTGRGGGFFGNEMERARQAGNEFRATETAKTYAPNPNLIPYLAQAGGASPSATSGMVQGVGQTSGNILPYLLAMQMAGKA